MRDANWPGSRTIVRQRFTEFIGAEIRSFTGETVVDIRQKCARIDRRRSSLQTEVIVLRVIEMDRLRLVDLWHVGKNIIVEQNAVLVLTRSVTVLLERLVTPDDAAIAIGLVNQ